MAPLAPTAPPVVNESSIKTPIPACGIEAAAAMPLAIGEADFTRLIAAARDPSLVSGYTHNFYKYPAGFSPKFVRAAIEIFTKAGDLVFDPFMGGGTSLVEAMALGPPAFGTDISALAAFVAAAKTTLYDEAELVALTRWIDGLGRKINMRRQTVHFDDYAELGYYRYLDTAKTWRLRKAIEQALSTAIQLHDDKLETFARCAILRTAQWALDARKKLPRVADFRAALAGYAGLMIVGARELREAVMRHGSPPRVDCLNRPVAGVEELSPGVRPSGGRDWCSHRRPTPASTCFITGGRSTAAKRARRRFGSPTSSTAPVRPITRWATVRRPSSEPTFRSSRSHYGRSRLSATRRRRSFR